MDINIDDYITEEEKRQIAIDTFTAQCRKHTDEDFERIISNSAYAVVWKAVDECLDDKATEILREKVVGLIKDMTIFQVFSKPNAWDRVENQAYGVLMDSVRKNKPLLDNAIEFGVNNLTRKQKADLAYDAAKLAITKR